MLRLLIITLFMLSCGKTSPFFQIKPLKIESIKVAYSEDFSYSFYGEDSCSTDEQSARTLEEICEKLLDNELNNNCAEDKRVELYQSECS